MKVSIIIPTYNRDYILPEAIKSALGQTYRDFEIVVVDDGSTDSTAQIIQSLPIGVVRYIRHENNRGYSAACNTGVRAAIGDMVGFLDSDDIWRPDFLERSVGLLARNPDVDAAFSDVEIVDGQGNIPSLIGLMRAFPNLLSTKPSATEYILSARDMYICLLQEIPIKPSALLTRRQVYDKAGLFNESWPSGTDWDLFLRFSRFACFGYIHLPLVVQRWSSDATHRKHWEKDKSFLIQVFLAEKARMGSDNESLQAVKRGLASHYSNLAYVYLRSGRRTKAVLLYLEGFRETDDYGLLLRSLCGCLPLSWMDYFREGIRGARRQHAHVSKRAAG